MSPGTPALLSKAIRWPESACAQSKYPSALVLPVVAPLFAVMLSPKITMVLVACRGLITVFPIATLPDPFAVMVHEVVFVAVQGGGVPFPFTGPTPPLPPI